MRKNCETVHVGADKRHALKSTSVREGFEQSSFQHSTDRGDSRAFVAHSVAEARVVELLRIAGIQVNGNQPWDIQVHDARFFDRVLAQGTLGAGESYMD